MCVDSVYFRETGLAVATAVVLIELWYSADEYVNQIIISTTSFVGHVERIY